MRRRADGERGVELVEAAFVLPLVLLLTFGVIEWGLFFSTTAVSTSSTRAGARVGAAEFAPAGDKDAAADEIRDAVEAVLGTETRLARPTDLYIYRAAADGRPVGGFGCSVDCWHYTWDGTGFAADDASPGWSTPDACIGDGDDLDSLGVHVRVEHDFVTGFFGDSRTVEHKTVLRIEPLPLEQCGS